MNLSDCYEILGLQKDATQKEIKNAYRRLSLMYHPDKNKSNHDEGKFKQIIEAYQILRHEKKTKTNSSETEIASKYTEFWKKYGANMNEEFSSNFSRFRNPFGANSQENYSHFRENHSSHANTHMIIFGGLGLIALWILLSTILK